MKRIILLIALGTTIAMSSGLNAQNDAKSIGKQYFEMGEFFRPGKGLNPKEEYAKALTCFQKSASLNYPDGITALGELYQSGYYNLKKDVGKGFELFMKAYKLGGGRACYFLGRSYAYGMGCEVNYEKMIAYLDEGVKRGDAASMYGMGNMLYKGRGVEQSYEQAVAFFEKAAALGNSSAEYYLGVCYRNGYGVPKDEQKGKEYLEKSAKTYRFSRNELKRAEPEIIAAKRIENKEYDSPMNYKKVKHNAKNDSFAGQWSGYISFYDWSGKYKLNEREIELDVKVDGDKFVGNWTQEGNTFSISGIANQYGIVFSSGEFDFIDHFMDTVRIQIKTGSFETFEQGNKSILAGDISLFSITENAPERPAYVVLMKKKEDKKEDKKQEKLASIPVQPIANVQTTPIGTVALVGTAGPGQDPSVARANLGSETSKSQEEQIVSHLQNTNINSRVWPVPFKDNISVEYNLKTDGEIEIRLISIEGKLVEILAKEKRKAGLQIQHFDVNVPAGTYILQLLSNNMKASHIVIKK